MTIAQNSTAISAYTIDVTPGADAATVPFRSLTTNGTTGQATLSGGTLNVPVYQGASSENDVAFSATPAFTVTDGALNTITLTANVTSSTMTGTPVAGARVGFLVCQNATGNFTFAWPSSFHGAMTVGATASKCSEQEFRYVSAQSGWFATSTGVANE